MNQKSTAVATATPTNLLELAIEKGADVEKLEKLMALQERWEAQQAKKAYYASLSKFQSQCPPILKSKAGYDKRYYYAPLDKIISVIKDSMFKNGLTHRWEQKDKDKKIIVTCIITHVSGYSEQTTLEGEADTSGSKNTIQAKGSTVQYLRRYTLESVLGIATSSTDTDGESTKKSSSKISKAASADLLVKAKVVIDGYSDHKELKEHAKTHVQDSIKAGMHQSDLKTLKNYGNSKMVALKKSGEGTQLELP